MIIKNILSSSKLLSRVLRHKTTTMYCRLKIVKVVACFDTKISIFQFISYPLINYERDDVLGMFVQCVVCKRRSNFDILYTVMHKSTTVFFSFYLLMEAEVLAHQMN